jgi:uncharacterized membrane protein YphA (DoxX/SURF4 family)
MPIAIRTRARTHMFLPPTFPPPLAWESRARRRETDGSRFPATSTMASRENWFAGKWDRLDAGVAALMARCGITLLRVSLGIIFFWFGMLKVFPGLSPAEALAGKTIAVLTHGLVQPAVSVPMLGLLEFAIGLGLLTGRALRLTLVVLFVQMAGTVTPLSLFPSEVFIWEPFVPTMEGQYIIKNLVLISSAIVLGATVRGGRLSAEPGHAPTEQDPHHQRA